jgi:hypothetical protein
MKYQTIVTGISGKVETIKSDDSGMAREVFANAKESPFHVAGFIQSISETGQPVTLERFTRH